MRFNTCGVEWMHARVRYGEIDVDKERMMAWNGECFGDLVWTSIWSGRLDMLGVYMQRSWVILLVTALPLMCVYIFATPLLRLIGQPKDISVAAGRLALWMIPQLFAYAMNFPIAKFLQAQSKVMFMACVSVTALVLHTLFSWVLMLRLGWGLAGGAIVLNCSWWFIVVAQLVYIFHGGCGQAWSGFSWAAFHNLWGFVRLSLSSAFMLCMEIWYFMLLVLFAGYMKNVEAAVDALSICTNISGWVAMVAVGVNAAISVRVSNELGAAHPRTAKFSVMVVLVAFLLIGLLFTIILVLSRHQYSRLFADSADVQYAVNKLTPLLAACIMINNIQPALSGPSYYTISGRQPISRSVISSQKGHL